MVLMMTIRGIVEVLGLNISSMMDASISGLAGLSHIIIAFGLHEFFSVLQKRIEVTQENKSTTTPS